MPDYNAINDRAARQIAISVANRCRALGRPVTWKEVHNREAEKEGYHKESRKDRDLLQRAVALHYLTAYEFSNASLFMPHGWGFGPQRKGCCK